MLNLEVFENIKVSNKRILVVTKYWNTEETSEILNEVKSNYPGIFYGIGENRIEQIKEKNLPREQTHFIGNIQSNKIKDIVNYCSTIHSLENIEHARKIESQKKEISAFIQIHLDTEKDIGILPTNIGNFLEKCKDFKYLKIIGISGMGNLHLNESEKGKEFQQLASLRDTHLPSGLISAGTSIDYTIALEEGIDIVRVGKKIMN